jgi:hypothetical protein
VLLFSIGPLAGVLVSSVGSSSIPAVLRDAMKLRVSRSSCYVEVEVEVILRPTVSRPFRLGVRHPSETSAQFFFLLEIFFR